MKRFIEKNMTNRIMTTLTSVGGTVLGARTFLPVNAWDAIEKEKSIRYKLNNPKELSAVEISSDLTKADFYFSAAENTSGTDNHDEHKNDSYELMEERDRIRGTVSSSVHPPLPEIGHVSTDREKISIYGMESYSDMSHYNREHIERKYCTKEQLHPVEWILTKARNSDVLPNDLYKRIRIDVRRRVAQLKYDDGLPFRHITNGVVDWTPERENMDKSVPPKPLMVYLIRGGDENARHEKVCNLTKELVSPMYGVYHNKDKSESAVVFSYDHDTYNLMNFNMAKEFSGANQLNEFSPWGVPKQNFGIIDVSDEPQPTHYSGMRPY